MNDRPEHDEFFDELLRDSGPLRLLVESTIDFVSVVDREHRHRYINRTFPGFTVEEVLGTSVYDYTEPRYHDQMRECLTAVFESGEPQILITEATGAPGETRWYKTRFSPLSRRGEVVAVSLIATDITTERQAEVALEQERRLQSASLDAVEGAIVSLDSDGNIAAMNRVGADLLGVNARDVLGLSWVEHFVPEDHRERTRIGLDALYSGSVDHSRNVNEIVDARGKRRLISWNNVAIRGADGNTEGLIGFGEDITEIGVPREERLERESLLMSIFAATPTGIGFVQDRVFTRVNGQLCDLIGFSEDELVGRKSRIMYASEEEYERAGESVYGQLEHADRASVQAKLRRKDGSLLDALISAAPLDPADPDAGITFTVLDVTDRLRMEAELQDRKTVLEEEVAVRTVELSQLNEELLAANSAKNQFLAAMSHELRTPLNSVIGFAGIMLDGMAGEITDEQARQLGMVRGAGHRLLALVNDILDLAKIEEGRLELDSMEFTLGQVVEEAVDMLRLGARNKGLEIDVNVLEPTGVLHTDHRSVEQILVNLLSNAVKYTDEGEIAIRAAITEDTARFEVQDTGVGIRKDDQSRIFDAFHRAGDPNSGRTGTGLGLAISSRLANRLGGTLEVESELGQGSTFTLVLPRTLPSQARD